MSNLRNDDTKMIKIKSEKHVYSKGGIYGPVLTPFRETVANIFLMILENIKVVEVLKDGSEVELTIMNFNKENEGAQLPSQETGVESPAEIPVEMAKPNTVTEVAAEAKVVEEQVTTKEAKKIKEDKLTKK